VAPCNGRANRNSYAMILSFGARFCGCEEN